MLDRVLLAALVSIAFLPPANAQSMRSVLEDFGFFGNWAINCASPATLANSRRHAFITRGGEIHFTESFGHKIKQNVYTVFGARRIAPDKILLRIQLNGKDMQNLTMQKDNSRLRTIFNERENGEFLVRDGVILSNGQPTPWLSPCSGYD
jgi:hypothetical protein